MFECHNASNKVFNPICFLFYISLMHQSLVTTATHTYGDGRGIAANVRGSEFMLPQYLYHSRAFHEAQFYKLLPCFANHSTVNQTTYLTSRPNWWTHALNNCYLMHPRKTGRNFTSASCASINGSMSWRIYKLADANARDMVRYLHSKFQRNLHTSNKYVRVRNTRLWRIRSGLSHIRRVKKSNVFVTPVKNSCEFFTRVKNSIVIITRVTNAFTFVTRTYLSQVTNSNESVTRVKNSFEFFTRLKIRYLWKIRTY